MSSIGSRFVVTCFGDAKGPVLGAVIDGCPAGVSFESSWLERELGRALSTDHLHSTQPSSTPEILSGVYQGKTLGTPIAITLPASPEINPSIAPLLAGVVAQMYLREQVAGLRAYGFVSQIANLRLRNQDYLEIKKRYQSATPPLDNHYFDQFRWRFPSPVQANEAEKLISAAEEKNRELVGLVEIWIENVVPNLGQPVFHKLKADLAQALFSLEEVTTVEVGDAWLASLTEGSQFHGGAKASGNSDVYGGIRGGLSTGDRIVLRVGLSRSPARVVPVLEALTYGVLADHHLWLRTDRAK